jgi:hypothetical protein
MIDAATRRNAAYVEAGTAEFLVAELEELDLGDRRFDAVFAVRVRSFEVPLVEPWLAPGGRILSEYD